MKMNNCRRFMKYFLCAINLVILIVGITGTITIVWGLVDVLSWLGEAGNNRLAAVLIIGIITISIAIFGIIAVLRETKRMLLIYVVFVFLLFVFEINSIVNRQYNSRKEMKLLEKEMKNSLQFYNDIRFIRNFWDITQSKYQCCGVNSWEDWETHGFKVPERCCKSAQLLECNADRHTKNISEVFYAEGCVNKLLSHMKDFANITNGIIITLLCLMFFGMTFSLAFYDRIK